MREPRLQGEGMRLSPGNWEMSEMQPFTAGSKNKCKQFNAIAMEKPVKGIKRHDL